MQNINRKLPGFSKSDSMALKGIAVVMLVFYHCFVGGKPIDEFGVNLFPFSRSFADGLVLYFKICVPVFAFISGYGLYQSYRKTEEKQTVKWEISRIIKTLSGFWFVFALYLLGILSYRIFTGSSTRLYFKKGFTQGLINLFLEGIGMAKLFGTPTATVTWWYMGAAVVFVILLPIIYKTAEKYGYFMVTAVIVLLPRLLNTGNPGSMNPYTFLLAFTAGMFFSGYGLFSKLQEMRFLKNKKTDTVIQLFLWIFILTASFKVYTRMKWSVAWEINFAVCPVIFICFCKKYILDIPGLRKILMFLGKYSMNIFLIHSIIKNQVCKDFIYASKSFWLIPLVLLGISLIFAVVIEWIKTFVSYEKGIQKLTDCACRLVDVIAADTSSGSGN